MAVEKEFDTEIPDEEWDLLANSTVGRTIEYMVKRLNISR
jgi:acyl carrier protein